LQTGGIFNTIQRAPQRKIATAMPRVVGIDHLVLSVGDLARSKEFYRKLLGFLGFKLKYEYDDMVGWSNGKTLFWIAALASEASGQRGNSISARAGHSP
jgi:catechol 2,3-dioxygenase-like lactoylglutathione lyase family enzyme